MSFSTAMPVSAFLARQREYFWRIHSHNGFLFARRACPSHSTELKNRRRSYHNYLMQRYSTWASNCTFARRACPSHPEELKYRTRWSYHNYFMQRHSTWASNCTAGPHRDRASRNPSCKFHSIPWIGRFWLVTNLQHTPMQRSPVCQPETVNKIIVSGNPKSQFAGARAIAKMPLPNQHNDEDDLQPTPRPPIREPSASPEVCFVYPL
jgi:hypothetical protein